MSTKYRCISAALNKQGPCFIDCGVVAMMFWLDGAMEINYSCCLISPSDSAWFPPRGAPPKSTGEQGTPTQSAGTGHKYTPQLPQLAGCTITHAHTGDTMHAQLSSQLLPNKKKKNPVWRPITGFTTKWGFPEGTLRKPATEQVAACDLLRYKYSKHPMWNTSQSTLKQVQWGHLCKQQCNNNTAAWRIGLMGAQIDGCGLAEVWGRGQSVQRKMKEEGVEAAGVQATVRQALPAVTGLSLPGGVHAERHNEGR